MGRVHTVGRGSITVGKKLPPRAAAAAKRPRAADGSRGATRSRRPKAEPRGIQGEVAHQLRNRLGAIANAVYYLKLVSPPDDRIREYLDILEREVRALRQVFDPATGTSAGPDARS